MLQLSCYSFTATYSNMENHPRLIRARTDKPAAKIRLDPKTGLPTVADAKSTPEGRRSITPTQDELRRKFVSLTCNSLFTSCFLSAARITVSRPKNESKEEKKARKHAVKAERQERRAEKKSTKEQFAHAIKQEVRTAAVKENMAKTLKL